MKTLLSILAVLALASSGLGCASTQVERVHDPEFDFSAGNTYRWAEQDIPRDTNVSWDTIDRAVKSTVDAEMQRNGVSKAGTEASYELHYFIGADEVDQISSHYGAHYYGVTFSYWGWVRGPGAYAQDARLYDQGSFTLDVLDAKKGVLIWRGTAAGTIKANSLPKERLKNLEKTVAQLLAGFPPKGS